MTCFRPRKCLLGVRPMGDVIWGKYSSKTPPKRAWIGSFKPKHQNLYIAISLELLIRLTSDLRWEFRPRKYFVGGPPLPQSKCNMADGRHLKNRYDVIFQRRMFRFGRNSSTGCGMTRRLRKKWSRSKPEVKFQYGGPLYFETGSSYISAANWDIWMKFGLLIDFDLLKAVTSTNTKPEVVFSGRGRHFEK